MPIPRAMELEVNGTDFVRQFKNIHPMLGWYKPDLDTGKLSYDQFCSLLLRDNEAQLIELLDNAKNGLIAKNRPCVYSVLLHIRILSVLFWKNKRTPPRRVFLNKIYFWDRSAPWGKKSTT